MQGGLRVVYQFAVFELLLKVFEIGRETKDRGFAILFSIHPVLKLLAGRFV